MDAKELVLDLGEEEHPPRLYLQRCVGYFRNLHSSEALESQGHRVVNNFRTTLIAGNKAYGTTALLRAKVPTPKTKLAFTREAALKAIDSLGYPSVLKPVVGSWGRLAALMSDPQSAESILENREFMFPLYQVYYLQEFVKRPPRDIRSFVIGGHTVAAIYRKSEKGQWRTNTARGGRAEDCPITDELDDLSVRAAEAVGGEVVGVDLMETKEGLLVHEVNSTTEFKNTVPATGVDIPSLIVDYLVSIRRG